MTNEERRKAAEWFRNRAKNCPMSATRRMYEIATEALEVMPSAQQWIPCSERLPQNEKKTYWVCTDTGHQCECRWTNVNHFWTDITGWHWHIMDIPRYTEVVAWMPLPEPYKEEEAQDEV